MNDFFLVARFELDASPQPDTGQVWYSQRYSMWLDHERDARGDPTVEIWRFCTCKEEGEDGCGYLALYIHEIIETNNSGRLAVYYRQWFAPDGKPAWGNRPKRVIGSFGSFKALLKRRKMTFQGYTA